mmetsp:Transcript_2154/g.6067  ORF Transcript_2154/g.6067 Transcript_2154/m.6067 type:complete len:593 (-) Transcript_2154:69-1847(-)
MPELGWIVRRIHAEGGDDSGEHCLVELHELGGGEVREEEGPGHGVEEGRAVVEASVVDGEDEPGNCSAEGGDGEFETIEAEVCALEGGRHARRLLHESEPRHARGRGEVEVESEDGCVGVHVEEEEPVHGRAPLARGRHGIWHRLVAASRAEAAWPEEPGDEAERPHEREQQGAAHHRPEVEPAHQPRRGRGVEGGHHDALRGRVEGGLGPPLARRAHALRPAPGPRRVHIRRSGSFSSGCLCWHLRGHVLAVVPHGREAGGAHAAEVLHEEEEEDAGERVRGQQAHDDRVEGGQREALGRHLQEACGGEVDGHEEPPQEHDEGGEKAADDEGVEGGRLAQGLAHLVHEVAQAPHEGGPRVERAQRVEHGECAAHVARGRKAEAIRVLSGQGRVHVVRHDALARGPEGGGETGEGDEACDHGRHRRRHGRHEEDGRHEKAEGKSATRTGYEHSVHGLEVRDHVRKLLARRGQAVADEVEVRVRGPEARRGPDGASPGGAVAHVLLVKAHLERARGHRLVGQAVAVGRGRCVGGEAALTQLLELAVRVQAAALVRADELAGEEAIARVRGRGALGDADAKVSSRVCKEDKRLQ